MSPTTLTSKPSSPRRDDPVNDDMVVVLPRHFIDLARFREWAASDEFPDRHRISFLDGEVMIDMSYEEYMTHVLVKTAIVAALGSINEREDLGLVCGDGGRVTNVEANISNEPDAMFVSYDSLESKAAAFTPRKSDPDQSVELVGTPDVVIEVVSNSSVAKDYEKLRVGYFLAGIPEYWLVDARGDQVVFQILTHRRTGYTASPNRDGWIRSRVFDREFRLLREKSRVDTWKYRLESRTK